MEIFLSLLGCLLVLREERGEILSSIMVKMLNLPERAPPIAMPIVGGENTTEHSPEDSKKEPPVPRAERRKQENIVYWIRSPKVCA